MIPKSEILFNYDKILVQRTQYKEFNKRHRLNIRKHSFCIRSVELWNGLPDRVVEACTVILSRLGSTSYGKTNQ